MDRHNLKIVTQRASIAVRTEDWRLNREIPEEVADEILGLLQGGDLNIWRPQLYVILKTAVDAGRVKLVPLAERAGMGDEFRIANLQGSEFDRITFDGF